MQVLIAYAGKNGTTKKAAQLLAKEFEGATIRNLHEKVRAEAMRYDAVIIGSSVYRGLIDPTVRRWLIQNEKLLRGKRKGIFLCNAFLDETPDIIAANFPPALIDDCVACTSFGGEIPTSGLSFSDRMWLASHTRKRNRKNKGTEDVVPCLMTDAIKTFADEINRS